MFDEENVGEKRRDKDWKIVAHGDLADILDENAQRGHLFIIYGGLVCEESKTVTLNVSGDKSEAPIYSRIIHLVNNVRFFSNYVNYYIWIIVMTHLFVLQGQSKPPCDIYDVGITKYTMITDVGKTKEGEDFTVNTFAPKMCELRRSSVSISSNYSQSTSGGSQQSEDDNNISGNFSVFD